MKVNIRLNINLILSREIIQGFGYSSNINIALIQFHPIASLIRLLYDLQKYILQRKNSKNIWQKKTLNKY